MSRFERALIAPAAAVASVGASWPHGLADLNRLLVGQRLAPVK